MKVFLFVTVTCLFCSSVRSQRQGRRKFSDSRAIHSQNLSPQQFHFSQLKRARQFSEPVAAKQEQRAFYPEITSCPEEYGEQAYHHPTDCHQFYKCVNGTLTQETCENGLLFDGKGGIYNHCNYHWRANCEGRDFELAPINQGRCEFSFGIYPAGACEDHYVLCEFGEEIYYPCEPGLAYDERKHGCNWADMMEACDAESFVGFSCPKSIDPRDLAYRFYPFPRYASKDCGRYIVCVSDLPRLVGCGDGNVFDESTLTCAAPEYVPKCANYFK